MGHEETSASHRGDSANVTRESWVAPSAAKENGGESNSYGPKEDSMS